MFTFSHAHLVSQLTALQQTLQAQPAGQALARSLALWLTRLTNTAPTLLLLGNYNAGKSTLINVLIGKAVAPTADIPLTDRLTDYRWQGLCLRDTPGLNAPIAHEAVTEAALDNANLILMVVRSGDVDEANLYQQIARLLRRGCALFIVLNGDSSEPALLASWQQRLCQHLVALENEGVDPAHLTATRIIPLNLQTAWYGREQGEPLLSASGYPLLSTALTQWAQTALTDAPWRRPLLDEICSGLQLLMQSAPLDPRMQTVLEERQHWQRVELRLQQQGRCWVTARLIRLRPQLCKALQLHDATAFIAAEMGVLCDELHAWLSVQQPHLQWPALHPVITALPDPQPDEPAADLIDDAIGLAIPLLQSTLFKVGVKINPFINLLLGAAEIYRSHYQQEQQIQRLRENALLEQQRVTLLMQQLETTLTEALNTAISTALHPVRVRVEQQQAELCHQQSMQAEQQQVWRYWQQELQSLLGHASDHLVTKMNTISDPIITSC
ncbi:GTPase [Aeromonas veronii]